MPRNLFCYIVAYDSGFAPNPFHGYCTLATCKPLIRKHAQVGDWIVGTGSNNKKVRRGGYLVHAMRVAEAIPTEEYWVDPRFQEKKPNLHCSWLHASGDNIYEPLAPGEWRQLNSYHSSKDGSQSKDHMTRDTGVNRVLVSSDFVYFGAEGPKLPERYLSGGAYDIVCKTRGYRRADDPALISDFESWVGSLGKAVCRANPGIGRRSMARKGTLKPKSQEGLVSIREYEVGVADTDRLPRETLEPVLLGLFGEVGSVMSTSKKLHREKEAYAAYFDAVTEEFGDTLWYLSALCRRCDFSLSEIIQDCSTSDLLSKEVFAGSSASAPVANLWRFEELATLDQILLSLGRAAASLLDLKKGSREARAEVKSFVTLYLQATQATGIPFGRIANHNLEKARGRFIKPDFKKLPNFDSDFPEEERIPDKFEIEISQRSGVRSYLRMNGVFIGDPLTDNISDPDGYRFHDVFHFAHAAVLHWSPTFRALIKHKRKSQPRIDEAQDSGRAIVIEEGLSAYIYSCAKDLDFFEGQNTVSLDLLKTIRNFVRGYEVDQCPLWLWESAILQGYDAFRKIRRKGGGVIIADRISRTVGFRALP